VDVVLGTTAIMIVVFVVVGWPSAIVTWRFLQRHDYSSQKPKQLTSWRPPRSVLMLQVALLVIAVVLGLVAFVR
jgi:uncharacterized membrane protein